MLLGSVSLAEKFVVNGLHHTEGLQQDFISDDDSKLGSILRNDEDKSNKTRPEEKGFIKPEILHNETIQSLKFFNNHEEADQNKFSIFRGHQKNFNATYSSNSNSHSNSGTSKDAPQKTTDKERASEIAQESKLISNEEIPVEKIALNRAIDALALLFSTLAEQRLGMRKDKQIRDEVLQKIPQQVKSDLLRRVIRGAIKKSISESKLISNEEIPVEKIALNRAIDRERENKRLEEAAHFRGAIKKSISANAGQEFNPKRKPASKLEPGYDLIRFPRSKSNPESLQGKTSSLEDLKNKIRGHEIRYKKLQKQNQRLEKVLMKLEENAKKTNV
ncbi:unnamed protein product [Notodromas monacha]|uniref:Uncharacterized protein n=1 Tax=Notodromas monacha TaxID=399045 RepID=A0A7R9GH43_9CRUS|nr:unnamed protein product [Notodromas monacha]CAG0921090.1 unnamed protein product [Notodromas monacha]